MRGVAEPLVGLLRRIIAAHLQIFVDRLRDHADVELLCRLGLAVSEKGEALLAAIVEPLLKAEAFALRLRDLLALFVEEHLVDQPLGLAPAERLGDLARLDAAVGQVLAIHFIIDAERDPAHRPVNLPLQLRAAAKDRMRDCLALILERHQPRIGIDDGHRHLQHDPRLWADRQDRRIGRRTLGAQRREHDVEDVLIVAEDVSQRLVECARLIALGRAHELVLKAETVEKLAQHRIVMMRKTFILGERIGDSGQRLAEIFAQHVAVWYIVGNLAEAIHIVAERDQPRRRAAGQRLIGAADHRRTQHFVEGADMRQSRGAIARLEQHRLAAGLAARIAFDDLARFLERPCLGRLRGLAQRRVKVQVSHSCAP